MRKFILLLIIILICSFTFAELNPLIKYSTEKVDSHACIPTSGNCAYINSILIEDTYLGDSLGIKILGLSKDPLYPGTNAHVETAHNFGEGVVNEHNNYSEYGIYLTLEGESKCRFTKGASCGVGNCILGISDETNAHLSKCDTFGNNEIKLCCEFEAFFVNYPVGVTTDGCEVNYFEANNVFVDENVNIEYSCSSAVDVNIMIFDSKGNPLLPSPHQTNCDLIKQVYDEFVFTEVQKIAIVTIQTENCVKEKIFTVKSKVRSAIPDNNLFLVLFIVIIVSIILVKKKD